jgi:hypothetical protein
MKNFSDELAQNKKYIETYEGWWYIVWYCINTKEKRMLEKSLKDFFKENKKISISGERNGYLWKSPFESISTELLGTVAQNLYTNNIMKGDLSFMGTVARLVELPETEVSSIITLYRLCQ